MKKNQIIMLYGRAQWEKVNKKPVSRLCVRVYLRVCFRRELVRWEGGGRRMRDL